VGSLQQHLSEEALLTFIQDLLAADDPQTQVEQLARLLEEHADTLLRPSTKHMVGRQMGHLEPAPSLKYRASA